MHKLLVLPAIVSLTAALAFAPAGSTALGSPNASSAGHIAVMQGTARVARVVNVATLPRAIHVGGPARVLPRLTPDGPAGVSSSGGSASSPSVRAPQTAPTVTAGTKLKPALASSDNPFGLSPPDMGLAVGGGRVIQMVNVVGRIWNGTTAGTVFDLSDFFGTGGDFISDPWVQFDPASGRFYAGIFDVDLGGEAIAVSTSSNAAGTYVVYYVQYPAVANGGCPDQGKLGFDKDIVALGFNEFSTVGCSGGSYLGAGIEIFNKAELVAGATVHFVYTNPLPAFFSMIPAETMTANVYEYFASVDYGSGTKVHQITSNGVPHGGGSDVTLTQLPDVTVPAYANPPQAKQPGTSTKVDSGDDRVQHVSRRGGNLALSLTDKCTPSGDTKNRACARIISINQVSNALTYSRDLSKRKHFYIYPAIGLNSLNQVIVGFGDTSGGTYPRLMASAADLSGNFAAPLVLQSGSQPNITTRYGDYFAVAIDPANPTNGWIAGEVGGPLTGSSAWNTAVRLLVVS